MSWLLTVSPGWPSGPAKCARPPSRATAMAALTAQPPGITANSLVMHLPPGGGNSATRNTMSCTAMPTHRMAGALEEGTVALHPAADDVMRDGDRRRTGQALGMFAHQHRGA